MEELAGRTVMITGAAGGIGSALASAFASEGANLVLLDVAVPDSPLEFADVEVLWMATDVRESSQWQDAVAAAKERFGSIDVLCNNAGIGGLLGPTWELPQNAWADVMGVNVDGVVNGIRAVVPTMIEQGRGHVVNTASMAGLLPMPFGSPYVASKHAVVGLTSTLKWELTQMRTGVSASVLCPGWVQSAIATGPGAGVLDGHQDGPAGAMAAMLAQNVSDGQDPLSVAQRVVRAVREDAFWILTHPDQAASMLPYYQEAAQAARGPDPDRA